MGVDFETKIVYGLVASEEELSEAASAKELDDIYDGDSEDYDTVELLEEVYGTYDCSLFCINEYIEDSDYVVCDSATERSIDCGCVERLDMFDLQEIPSNPRLEDFADLLGKKCCWMVILRVC